jgi:hypothetical protein
VTATGATSAILVPRDTTANRPTGANGMLRYNLDLQAMEMFSSGGWSSIASSASVSSAASQWKTNGSDIYYNTGKVAVGTTTPLAGLHAKVSSGTSILAESSASDAQILLKAGGTTAGSEPAIGVNGGDLYFNLGSTQVMRFLSTSVKINNQTDITANSGGPASTIRNNNPSNASSFGYLDSAGVSKGEVGYANTSAGASMDACLRKLRQALITPSQIKQTVFWPFLVTVATSVSERQLRSPSLI